MGTDLADHDSVELCLTWNGAEVIMMSKEIHATAVVETDDTCPKLELRLLRLLCERGAQTMDQLTSLFPMVSWSQVFLAVDRLSRTGSVSLRKTGAYEYRVLPHREI
jgi:hypothetical protein